MSKPDYIEKQQKQADRLLKRKEFLKDLKLKQEHKTSEQIEQEGLQAIDDLFGEN